MRIVRFLTASFDTFTFGSERTSGVWSVEFVDRGAHMV